MKNNTSFLVLAIFVLTGCSHLSKNAPRTPASAEGEPTILHCQHTLTFHVDPKSTTEMEPAKIETFNIAIADMRNAQQEHEKGHNLTLLGRSFLVMEPRFGGALSKISNYHWEIGYYFRLMERDNRPFIEISVNTVKTGYKTDFVMKMGIPVESGKSSVLTWVEKKRRYTPEYSLECEVK